LPKRTEEKEKSTYNKGKRTGWGGRKEGAMKWWWRTETRLNVHKSGTEFVEFAAGSASGRQRAIRGGAKFKIPLIPERATRGGIGPIGQQLI
jgi:hypothetical protein